MDLIGALSSAAGAAGAGGTKIQEVFNAYPYVGTGSSLAIVNDIDLATEGGLVWLKRRSTANSNWFFDTVRGGTQILRSNTTEAQFTSSNLEITSFNSNGFTLGTASDINSSLASDISWTFRKTLKFFDIVTYTGTGSARTVSHNLGSVPGCIIVKRTSAGEGWQVYHRSTGATKYLELQNQNAVATSSTRWNNTAPTDSVFTVGTHSSVNASGSTYVAYLFAHDDGGFGAGESENVISCGDYTGNGSATGPTVSLGYEPQWLMIKATQNTSTALDNWVILDAARDASNPRNAYLEPNTSDAEATGNDVDFNSTSFQLKSTSATVNKNAINYIYIAIRADM